MQIFSKLWSSPIRESKECKVYEVSNSKRWTLNSNNDAGEKVQGYYTEPENVKKSKVQSEMEERYANDDLEEFGPADDVEGSQQTGAEVDV